MKRTRLILLLTSTLMAASPASSAVVTMLQFGSYETRVEAEKRLTEIKEKYKNQLGQLELSIREAKLPESNLTVYRTQAGPIENRANAQGTCAMLATAGDECYVVQSAVAEASVQAASVEPVTQSAQPDVTERLSLVKDEATKSASESAPALANEAVATPEAAAEQSTAAMAEEVPASVNSELIDQANAALDQAIEVQPDASESVTTAVAAAETEHGFWYWLNPLNWFGDDEAQEAAAAPSGEGEAAVVAPNEPMAEGSAQAPEAFYTGDQMTTESTAGWTDDNSVQEMTASPAPATVDGTVQVDEATRVPLTESVAATPSPAPAYSSQPQVAMDPGATVGEKSLWAQVGPFTNSDEALEFWKRYREAHPDFPVVRVRTVTGYQEQMVGINRTWLRVGPVANTAFADVLCADLPQDTQLSCGLMSDMGIAASRQEPSAGSRYQR